MNETICRKFRKSKKKRGSKLGKNLAELFKKERSQGGMRESIPP
jgi:hypothetical protein